MTEKNPKTEMFGRIQENHNQAVAINNARIIKARKAEEFQKRERKAIIAVAMVVLLGGSFFAVGNSVVHKAWEAQGCPTIPVLGSAGEVLTDENGKTITKPDYPGLIEGIEILSDKGREM